MNANILVDPWLRVKYLDGSADVLNLPQLFAALERDEVASFPGLRPHQAHPWHAFLCQLAAMALRADGESLPHVDPDVPTTFLGGHGVKTWLDLIRALTPGYLGDEPWILVVADAAKPAFMQPPYPGDPARLLEKGSIWQTPDDADILISSKGHGIKPSSTQRAGPDNWVFALISLQTHAPYGGRELYNSTRQNSGTGSRSCVRLAYGLLPGNRFIRDTRAMLDHFEHAFESEIPYNEKGLGLVWLSPWDGTTSIAMDRLHPWFIEAARLIRMIEIDSQLRAVYLPTKTTRLSGKAHKGNVGDPWIPIERKEAKAFNTKPRYDVVRKVLFDESTYSHSLTLGEQPFDPKEGLSAEFSILIRGNCVTEGFERRFVPIPNRVRPLFSRHRDLAAGLSQSMVDLAKAAENKVLWPAVTLLMQPKAEFPDFGQKETTIWARKAVDALDAVVDERFFDFLWPAVDMHTSGESVEESLAAWRDFLLENARVRFEAAIAALPLSSAARLSAIAKAELLFNAGARKHLRGSRKEVDENAG